MSKSQDDRKIAELEAQFHSLGLNNTELVTLDDAASLLGVPAGIHQIEAEVMLVNFGDGADGMGGDTTKFLHYQPDESQPYVWVMKRVYSFEAMKKLMVGLFIGLCILIVGGPALGLMLGGFIGVLIGLCLGTSAAMIVGPFGLMRMKAYPPCMDSPWVYMSQEQWRTAMGAAQQTEVSFVEHWDNIYGDNLH
ncbi:DUF456 domain-containing protein [Corynebacterium glutamicum]|nr:DUF456 domain-containing protein [Corynebacterium glutamicum]ARV64104.1 MFS transporter [Corynebacterium glutamicum]AUI01272.1 MFS transporter [Corynebacterium glutamicum]AUI04922.1 MFS transporter [Corynebacterium glutamicum]MBA4570583.1 DUF456 domain-containing protein [Corynebacterium glutamicum]MBA4573440.1 DUF456 domain-containing protein [Corynebacterium glutamicum]